MEKKEGQARWKNNCRQGTTINSPFFCASLRLINGRYMWYMLLRLHMNQILLFFFCFSLFILSIHVFLMFFFFKHTLKSFPEMFFFWICSLSIIGDLNFKLWFQVQTGPNINQHNVYILHSDLNNSRKPTGFSYRKIYINQNNRNTREYNQRNQVTIQFSLHCMTKDIPSFQLITSIKHLNSLLYSLPGIKKLPVHRFRFWPNPDVMPPRESLYFSVLREDF